MEDTPFHQKEKPPPAASRKAWPLAFHEEERFDPAFPFIAWNNAIKPFHFPPHWHERLEICYMLRGKLRVSLNRKEWDASEGDIIIVEAAAVHAYLDPSPCASVRIYQFAPEIIGDSGNARDAFLGPAPVLRRGTDGAFHSRMEELLNGMYREYLRRESGFRLAVKAKLCEFAVLFLRKMEEGPPCLELEARRQSKRRFRHVLSWLERNFDNPCISLEETARQAALSRFHFSRIFRAETGENFHAWLSRLRVRHARDCLARESGSITDIAYKCGFSSLATFNRLFKVYTGASPSRYRAGPDPQ